MMWFVSDAAEARDGDPAPGQPPAAGQAALGTLMDKVNWLIDRAHPGGRGPYTNAEVAELIHRTTGEPVSHSTIWKLRNGKTQDPHKRLIEAMARTFGVPPAFFFDDYDPQAAGQLREQVELLALVRDSGITAVQLRAIASLPDAAREAVVSLIEATARAESSGRPGDAGASKPTADPEA
jgi:transcriptional regulator with XRE-family HTH domain